MGNSKTLILIDGHALAFREYYALERTGMKTSDGQPTWAVFGFFKAIFDLLKNQKIKTDAIAVTFDVSHNTFRVEKYPNYKSNREQMPDAMRSQMDLIAEGLKAFNIPIYTKEGFEADDVIGTISREACELGHKVLILTGDQDAFQLIDKQGCVKVIIPSRGELREYDWNGVFEKLGVYPDQIIDYKALRGDTSDCIPGIKGIGEKTAQALLQEFGTLDSVIEHAEEIKSNSIRTKVQTGIEDARLSYFLATIIRDLDVNFDFDKTKVEIPDIAQVTEFLRSMQFYKFLKNINSILTSFNPDAEPVKVDLNKALSKDTSPTQTQLGLFSQIPSNGDNNSNGIKNNNAKLITDTEDFTELCNLLKKQSLIAFYLKSNFVNAVDNELIGITLAFKEGFEAHGDEIENKENGSLQTFYIPLRHKNLTTQLSQKDVLEGLKEIFENANIRKTSYDVKDEYNILRCNGIDLKGMLFDVQLASYVNNPSRKHELEIQSMEHLNHAIYEFADFEDIKKRRATLENSDIDRVLRNVCDEVATILELTGYWYKNLNKEELKVLYNIEIPMTKVLADMEFNGVSIDTKYLKELSEIMNNKLLRLERRIYNLADCGFNINSPKQVGEVLFDKLGLKSKKRKKSTSAEVLEELAGEYEIAKLLLDYRKFAKLKSTYTDALPALISNKDGRIHTSFNLTVTATGRLSSSNPNLQNIPTRTEEGNKIRLAFIPKDKEHYVMLSADYSQIELRLLAHISKDKHLIEAFTHDIDVHTLTASKVFEVPIDKVTKEMRYKAKAVNFGIIYGQSKYGLAKSVGITNSEADEFIKKYFETYPNIKLYMEATVESAEKNGYVETIFGRRRYLKSELESPNMMIREFAKRAAINQPLQGTAADLMKFAMIACSQKLKENNLKSKLILQVHDELVIETLKSELDQVKSIVREAMELNQPLLVPLVVDINTGETWKD